MCRSPTYCDAISTLPECSVNLAMLWAFSLQKKKKKKESKLPGNRPFERYSTRLRIIKN